MALIDDVLDEEINAKDLLVDELRPSTLEHWIDLLNDHMPRHIHTTVLTDTDVTNGHRLAYPVVWADRHYDTCPRCDQPVKHDLSNDCPLMLNPGSGAGGSIQEWSQQHGCGEWLSVTWHDLATTSSVADAEHTILATAQRLENEWHTDVDAARRQVASTLRTDLADAQAQLADDRDAAVIGSGHLPGVCRDEAGRLLAWDYDPAPTPEGVEADSICIYANEETTHGR